MNISVCIITKNEISKLMRCIDALKKYPFEIVVIDTGSNDGTQEYIAKAVDVCGDFQWCNDFSKARNYALSEASNDWVLVLDSDEYVVNIDLDVIESITADDEEIIGKIEIVSEVRNGDDITFSTEEIPRFFNRKHYKYLGRIHEQVVSEKNDKIRHIINIPIRVNHDGYIGTTEELALKAKRNIALLEMDLLDNGENPYTLYQLGKSYFMIGDTNKSLIYFEKSLNYEIDSKLTYAQDLVETYAYALLEEKRVDEMLFLEKYSAIYSCSSDYEFVLGLAYMNNGLWEKAIDAFTQATEALYCKVEGCNSYKAFYNAGVICECLGDKDKALDFYLKCGEYKQALDGIQRLT